MLRAGAFDADGFYEALDATRLARRLTWKAVAQQVGISASTLTRMAQGKRPDVDSLSALCVWSGLDADDFITPNKEPVEPLAMISTLLKGDPQLTPESAAALDELVKAAYTRLRKS